MKSANSACVKELRGKDWEPMNVVHIVADMIGDGWEGKAETVGIEGLINM